LAQGDRIVKTLLSVARWLLPSVTILALGAPGAGAEEAVLLASTAPGYSPGMIIPDGEAVSFPEGSRTTVLLRSGRMLELGGPFLGPIPAAEASSSALAAVTALIEQKVDMSAAGATRHGARAPTRATDGRQVVVDVEHPTTYCLGPADTIALQQPATAGQIITLEHAGTRRTVSWPSGSALAAWPTDLPVSDGDRFGVAGLAGATGAMLTFRRLATPTSDSAWIAQALLFGCVVQAAPALQQLREKIVVPALYLSSDRGRHPIYHVGDSLRLVLQSNRDGHLYCLVKQSDGATVPIFPAGATDDRRIQGHVPISIPPPRSSVEMRIGPPSGTDEVRCYLSGRDLGSEFASGALDGRITPPAGDRADDAWMATASLTVRVK
jgi:hypothetical protein